MLGGEKKMASHSAIQHRAGRAVAVPQETQRYFTGYDKPCLT